VNQPYRTLSWYEPKKQFANYIGLRKKLWGIGFGEKMWNFFYHPRSEPGGITHQLVPQTEWRDGASLLYQFARGGEDTSKSAERLLHVHKLCTWCWR